MKFRLITQEYILLEEEVQAVYAYGPDGRFGILPKHIPMVALLEIGVLCYFMEDKRHCAAIIGGILKTDGYEVLVLSPTAEKGDEIDVLRAEQAKQRAEELLRAKVQANVDVERAELALAKAMTRIKAAHGLFNP